MSSEQEGFRPFNVASFLSAGIGDEGIASPAFFEGWILGGPLRNSQVLTSYGLKDGMRFRIESVNFPGRTLIALEQNYYGPVRSMPYRAATQPVSMTIILSKDMREREVFMRWQDFMVGDYRVSSTVTGGMYDTRYYAEGIGTIGIMQYSYPIVKSSAGAPSSRQAHFGQLGLPDNPSRTQQGSPSLASEYPEFELQTRVVLEEAYPISVNDIQMSWADDGYARLQVEVRYHRTFEEHNTFGAPPFVRINDSK